MNASPLQQRGLLLVRRSVQNPNNRHLLSPYLAPACGECLRFEMLVALQDCRSVYGLSFLVEFYYGIKDNYQKTPLAGFDSKAG